MAILLGGRLIRYHLLIDPGGNWREQLWLDVLVSGPEVALAAAKTPKPTLTDPLPLNSCSLDSLTLLPGVGPVLAGRIDAARRAGVVFLTAQDLQRVKGIGPALSARLDSLVLYARTASADSNSSNSAKSR
jgi:predicted flap endonuclease-1-like 5' DNA nuclease